jgi:RNA polymerase sigma-70 factor (ECF subfamily)
VREKPSPDREEWLGELHRQHANAVYAYAYRRLAAPEDAEDVVVEVFATAWRRWADVPDETLPWLYATAANVIAHVIRGDARRRRLVARLAVVRPITDDDPVQRVVDTTVARDSVSLAMQDLPPADAELLRLWAWEQLEPAQIGQVLGCTAGTARTRLHRARTRLRESLQAHAAVGETYREAPAAGSEER